MSPSEMSPSEMVSAQVSQAIELRKFDVERIVSDFDRLLEFHCYEQQMCPKVNSRVPRNMRVC